MTETTATPEQIAEITARIAALFGAWTAETPLSEMRADFDAFLASDRPAHSAPGTLGGVPAEWLAAPGAAALENGPVVLYFHGGGYQMGSIRSHRDLMIRLSEAAGCRVVGVDYRLAPEHKFPAAVEDAAAAYAALLEEPTAPPPGRIALAGDSAGAGLAVAAMLEARAAGLPLPGAAVLLSPWLDMEATGATYDSRAAVDPMTQRDKIRMMARAYLGKAGDPRDPRASPIHADLAGLPPVLIHVGDHETVLDDSRRFAETARAAGCDVELAVWDRMIHHFQVFPELPETRRSLAGIADFLARRLAA